MKTKNNFLLREIAGQWVVVPLGNRTIELNAIISLSESGALLWKALERGAERTELVDLILKEYEIDRETAQKDVLSFVNAIEAKGLLD